MVVRPGAAGGCAGIAQGRGGWSQDAGGAHCGGEVGAEGVGEEARGRCLATPLLELHVNDSWLSQGACALAAVSSCKANGAPLTKGGRGACCSCQQR